MVKFRKLNEKGERIEVDNPKPITTKEEIQNIVKEALSEYAEGVEEFEGEDFVICPTCKVIYGFKSGEGVCVLCGAKYKDGQWSFEKQKKGKVEREKKLEDLVESEEAIQKESEDLEEINIGESGAPEYMEVKSIGISKCDGCGKKVNWDDIEPHAGLLGFAKKCPECDKEVYWLDSDSEQWVLKDESNTREEEDDFLDIV